MRLTRIAKRKARRNWHHLAKCKVRQKIDENFVFSSLAKFVCDAPPTRNHACEALALRRANDVDHLVLGENVRNFGFLLEEIRGEVHFLFDDAVVDLDLLDVGLLLPKLGFANGR